MSLDKKLTEYPRSTFEKEIRKAENKAVKNMKIYLQDIIKVKRLFTSKREIENFNNLTPLQIAHSSGTFYSAHLIRFSESKEFDLELYIRGKDNNFTYTNSIDKIAKEVVIGFTDTRPVFNPGPSSHPPFYLTKEEVEEGLSELNEYIEEEIEDYNKAILKYVEWYCPRKLKKIKSILTKTNNKK